MRDRFVTAKLLVIDSDTVIKNGAVHIRDGKVACTGLEKNFDLSRVKLQRFDTHILHPGFINVHCHLDLSFLAGAITPGIPFTDWIRELRKRKFSVTPEAMEAGIGNGVRRLLETGTTCVGDVTTSTSAYKALVDAGMRAVIFHEILGADTDPKEKIVALEKRIDACQPTDLVTNGVSPHAVYSTSHELMEAVVHLAISKDMPMTTHLCETKEEEEFARWERGPLRDTLVDFSVYRNGLSRKETPLESVDRSGALSMAPGGLLAVHMNHPNLGDTEKLKLSGAKIAHCPGSNRWFDRAVPPVLSYIKHGVPVALGSDSLASNTDLDMAAEMRELKSAIPELASSELFKMATETGAVALNLPKETGTLRNGAPFDAVAIDIGEKLKPDNPFESIMEKDRAVRCVFINGEKRYGG